MMGNWYINPINFNPIRIKGEQKKIYTIPRNVLKLVQDHLFKVLELNINNGEFGY